MESKSFKLFVSCEEAGHICDKSQYKETSWWQRFMLNIHTLYCNYCRKHTKKNGKLTKLCNEAKLKALKPEEKEKMKNVIAAKTLK